MHAPVLVAPPAAAPVSLAEVKVHLHVDGSDEDVLIQTLIDAATAHLDGYSGVLGRAMVTQTWQQAFDRFCGNCLRLPLPAASVSSVTVLDDAGAPSTIAGADYALLSDALGSYVRFVDGFDYPAELAETQGILVEFMAGYGAAAAVPAALKVAILLLVGHWFANREVVVTGTIATELPMSVAALIQPYRRAGV